MIHIPLHPPQQFSTPHTGQALSPLGNLRRPERNLTTLFSGITSEFSKYNYLSCLTAQSVAGAVVGSRMLESVVKGEPDTLLPCRPGVQYSVFTEKDELECVLGHDSLHIRFPEKNLFLFKTYGTSIEH